MSRGHRVTASLWQVVHSASRGFWVQGSSEDARNWHGAGLPSGGRPALNGRESLFSLPGLPGCFCGWGPRPGQGKWLPRAPSVPGGGVTDAAGTKPCSFTPWGFCLGSTACMPSGSTGVGQEPGSQGAGGPPHPPRLPWQLRGLLWPGPGDSEPQPRGLGSSTLTTPGLHFLAHLESHQQGLPLSPTPLLALGCAHTFTLKWRLGFKECSLRSRLPGSYAQTQLEPH